MKQTHRGSKIKQMSSIELNNLPTGSVYQTEYVGKGQYDVSQDGQFLYSLTRKQYLVEYKVQK